MRALAIVLVAACAGHTPPAPPPPVAHAPEAPLATPIAVEPPHAPAPPAPVPPPIAVSWLRAAIGTPNFVQSAAIGDDGTIFLGAVDDGAGWLAKQPRGKPANANAVIALDAAGKTKWVRALPKASVDAVAALPGGGVLACGGLNGTLSAGGKALASARGNAFVAALDASGAVRWAFAAAGGASACNAIAVLPDGSKIAFAGTISDGGTFGNLPAHALGGRDAFVAVLDAAGAPQWVAIGGSAEDDDARAIAVTRTHFTVTGYFGADAKFGEHALTLARGGGAQPVANPSNIFVARYNQFGETLWATSYGVADAFDMPWSIAALSDGGSAVAGEVGGQAILARYAPNGRQLWVRAASSGTARAVVALPDDQLVLAAYFGWPPSPHELTLHGTTRSLALTAGGSDTALARFSADGELLSAAKLAGVKAHDADDRDGDEVEVFAIARGRDGRLVLAGRRWGAARLDPGSMFVAPGPTAPAATDNGSLVVATEPIP